MDKEKQWIQKVKKNASKSAANRLVSKYYKEMYSYVYKQTLNEQLSLDLTQEIFIHVLKAVKNYDENRSSFRTWLYKVATNRLVDYYRSKSYKQTQLMEPIDEYEFQDEYDLIVSLEYKEDYEKVTSLVNKLDVTSQHIVRLKLFGEYTFQEIAHAKDIPESTVKTKYYAALRRLRQQFERCSHE